MDKPLASTLCSCRPGHAKQEEEPSGQQRPRRRPEKVAWLGQKSQGVRRSRALRGIGGLGWENHCSKKEEVALSNDMKGIEGEPGMEGVEKVIKSNDSCPLPFTPSLSIICYSIRIPSEMKGILRMLEMIRVKGEGGHNLYTLGLTSSPAAYKVVLPCYLSDTTLLSQSREWK